MFINSHTYYSLRYGTFSIEQYVTNCVENGITKIALTDINTTTAHLETIRIGAEKGVEIIPGIDFRNDIDQEFIVLATSNQGYEIATSFLTELLNKESFVVPKRAPQLHECIIIYPYHKTLSQPLEKNEFIGVRPQDINRFNIQEKKHPNSKYLALATASFSNKTSYNAHRLFRAIERNSLLSTLKKTDFGNSNDTFRNKAALEETYKEAHFLLQKNTQILDTCKVSFSFFTKETSNKKTFTASVQQDKQLLKDLAYKGLQYRYPSPRPEVFERIEKELLLIEEKGFISYFLINWDILCYARRKNYFYIGRGSGANSIVAYLLRITDVDPIELDLYFERFINTHRTNPPDFDIDFSWTDRDDITQYIFNTYKHVALVGVYNTFQYKAAVRELGKVFGLPKFEIDLLCEGKPTTSPNQHAKLVLDYAHYIQGFPNYLGIHASGIVISEKPINHYSACFLPPKGFPTLQIDMVVAENIGWYKFDILSQRGLSKIKDTTQIIKQNHPNHNIDIHNIQKFKHDPAIKRTLKKAQAIGCFYVESPAMRMLLTKLQVDNYLGLVAASSVIRPGVAKSGMMRQYIMRYRNPERRKDAHPILQEIMPDTFGVMVYQEDVIKVAHFFGGLSLAEADMLRRGMSGKFRSKEEFEKVRHQFFINCKQKGHSDTLTTDIWRQIESFAGYAFAKGHSASYAVESYQSLFLKTYFPREYMVATINNGGGFYRTELYLHEARMHGAIIEAPCINHSLKEASIQEKTIYIGLQFIQGMEVKSIQLITQERAKNGVFISLENFMTRVPIGLEQISLLIKINAFRFTGINKRNLLWNAHTRLNKQTTKPYHQHLFPEHTPVFETPHLDYTKTEDAFDEIELLGFPLCSPFELYPCPNPNEITSTELRALVGKTISINGYLITAKRTRTSNGKTMHFGTFIDKKGFFIDTVHFPSDLHKHPFRGIGVYTITGKVVSEFDFISIEVKQLERLAMTEDPRYSTTKQHE